MGQKEKRLREMETRRGSREKEMASKGKKSDSGGEMRDGEQKEKNDLEREIRNERWKT